MNRKSDPEITLYITVPPAAKIYFDLLLEVLFSLEKSTMRRIAENVEFYFLELSSSNGFMICPHKDRDTLIIFTIPPGRPFLEVIAHELGHYICGHEKILREDREKGESQDLLDFKPTAMPDLELEEIAQEQSRSIIWNYNKKRKNKAAWYDVEVKIETPVYFLIQKNEFNKKQEIPNRRKNIQTPGGPEKIPGAPGRTEQVRPDHRRAAGERNFRKPAGR